MLLFNETKSGQVAEFQKFIKNKKILLADQNPRTFSQIEGALSLGNLSQETIIYTENLNNAQKVIINEKPEIIICDYAIDDKPGMCLSMLLPKSKEIQLESKTPPLFILLTSSSSQVSVARAADEEVDGYILRPFTSSTLFHSILNAVRTKFTPDEYLIAIQKAKSQIQNENYNEATQILEAAKLLHPQPSLALSYLGEIHFICKNYQKAQEYFALGLKNNRIHKKSMNGLFDALMEQQKFEDAYTVLKRLIYYYPGSQERLTQLMKLAIRTKNYDDVEKSYQAYRYFKDPSPELTKHVCAAMVICGKYYLRKKFKSRGIETLKHAISLAKENTAFIREVFFSILKSGSPDEADIVLKLMPKETRETPEYFALAYALKDKTDSAHVIIEHGKNLLQKDVHDPIIYEILIKRYHQLKEKEKAQEMASQAIDKWPELEMKFAHAIKAARETN